MKDRQFIVCKAGTFKGFTRAFYAFRKTRNVEKFLGISFAEAPVNSRRFQRPELKAPLTSTFEATKYGASCLQLNW